MNVNNTYPISNNNHYSINNLRADLPDNLANNMPNGLIKVFEPQNNKNITNNLKNTNLRQIYTPKLAPSAGSFTENFLKSRATSSPIYKFNEVASKYEMTSVAPLYLKQLKKNIDLFL
jgi:hypothetical protein